MNKKTRQSAIIFALLLVLIFFVGTVLSACTPEEKPETIKVVFDINTNANIAEPDPVDVIKGEKVNKPSPDPVRSGYTFLGWFTNAAGTGDPYDFTTPITEGDENGNFRLYAGWEVFIPTYKVTYDYLGNGTNSTEDVKSGSFATPPTVTHLENFYFDGWYTDESCVSPFVAESIAIVRDITIYAKWTAAVTLSFDLNYEDAEGTPETQKLRSGDSPTRPTSPTRTGYFNFIGWFLNAEGTGNTFNFSAGLTSSTTVFAKWDITAFDITCSYNYEESPNDIIINVAKDGTLNTPAVTRPGHSFTGWFVDEECTSLYVSAPVIESFTLFAGWVVDKSVTFDLNYPGSTPIIQTYRHGVTPNNLPDNMTREDYNFGGWYVDEECTALYTPSALTQDLTVYAKWLDKEAESFVVTYSYNYPDSPENTTRDVPSGGLASMSPVTRQGYSFAGWFTDQACTSLYVSVPVTASFTLYAGWTVDKTITFNLNYEGSSPIIESYAHGATPVLPQTVTRANFTFSGWYLEAACINPYTPASLNSDITVYAKWLANTFDVEYVFNYPGATPASETRVVTRNSVIDPPVITRPGYLFTGWYTDSSCAIEYKYNDSAPVTSTLRLYAGWVVGVRIMLDSNYAGSNPTHVATIAVGTTYTKPGNPSHIEGGSYVFQFWSTTRKGTVAYDFNTPVTEDLTLYAQYKHEFVYEAEDLDFDNFFGFGASGGAVGSAAIANRENMVDDTRQYPMATDENYGLPTASNGLYVSYLFCHDSEQTEPDKTTTLTFNITSDRYVENASLKWRLSAEVYDVTIFSGDTVPAGAHEHNGKYTIRVNGQAIDYGRIDFTGVPGLGEADYKYGFKDYELGNITLNEGLNTIQLITDNTNRMFGTMAATAPMVDCIKIDTIAKLTWPKIINY